MNQKNKTANPSHRADRIMISKQVNTIAVLNIKDSPKLSPTTPATRKHMPKSVNSKTYGTGHIVNLTSSGIKNNIDDLTFYTCDVTIAIGTNNLLDCLILKKQVEQTKQLMAMSL